LTGSQAQVSGCMLKSLPQIMKTRQTGAVSVTNSPGPTTSPTKRILFVCVENSNRSQMAEGFARIHGASKVEAFSAGSRPSGQINPKVIDSMREIGYDLSRHRSKSISEIPDVEYDFVATMGCGDECPFVRARRREDWDIPDPKDMPPDEFRVVRDLIKRRVKDLLATI
jgi:arsenate reductase